MVTYDCKYLFLYSWAMFSICKCHLEIQVGYFEFISFLVTYKKLDLLRRLHCRPFLRPPWILQDLFLHCIIIVFTRLYSVHISQYMLTSRMESSPPLFCCAPWHAHPLLSGREIPPFRLEDFWSLSPLCSFQNDPLFLAGSQQTADSWRICCLEG